MDDPELDAMSTISKTLEVLDEKARVRVIMWACDRFGIGLPSPQSDPVTLEKQGPESRVFNNFAELFDSAQPKSESEKALVAAYWIQVCQGNTQFQAADLNLLLRDLGQRITNITDALTASQEQKPALVLQIKKSGSSKQSRKTYKLTTAGESRVKELMG